VPLHAALSIRDRTDQQRNGNENDEPQEIQLHHPEFLIERQWKAYHRHHAGHRARQCATNPGGDEKQRSDSRTQMESCSSNQEATL